jgi:hypothetical protein
LAARVGAEQSWAGAARGSGRQGGLRGRGAGVALGPRAPAPACAWAASELPAFLRACRKLLGDFDPSACQREQREGCSVSSQPGPGRDSGVPPRWLTASGDVCVSSHPFMIILRSCCHWDSEAEVSVCISLKKNFFKGVKPLKRYMC